MQSKQDLLEFDERIPVELVTLDYESIQSRLPLAFKGAPVATTLRPHREE
jgi:hypothetical protein